MSVFRSGNHWGVTDDGVHRYLSTACLHAGEAEAAGDLGRAAELHGHCGSMVGFAGVKRPAQCKWCESRCVCGCHGSEGKVSASPARQAPGNPRGYHPTCIETTGAVEISQGRRSFVCGPDCPPPPDSCTGCTAAKGDPACPVHEGRRPKGPKPPPLGAGCICDGSGRACPRHGEVI